jgi:hypothetical protein
MDVLPRHLVNAIHDLTHRRAMIQIARILGDDDIWFTMVDRIGLAKSQMLVAWAKRVGSNQLGPPKNWVEKYAGKARMNFTIAKMGLKWSIAVQNFANYANALEFVSPMQLARAMKDFTINFKDNFALVKHLSGEMAHRFESFDRDVRNNIMALQLEPGKKLKKKIQEMSFWAMIMTDAMVAYPMWLGMYRQETLKLREEGKLGDEAIEKNAIAAADSSVRLSLGSGSIKDVAEAQAGGEWLKWGTMFYSWFSNAYSAERRMGRTAGKGIKTLSPGMLVKALGMFAAINAAPAIISELLSGRGPDDDEDWVEWAAIKVLIYPTMTVPGVRDITGSLEGRLIEGRHGERSGVVGSISKDFTDAVEAWIELMEGDLDASPEKVAKETARFLAQFSGFPVSQPEITGGYMEDIYTGEAAPEDVFEFVQDFLYRRKREKSLRAR